MSATYIGSTGNIIAPFPSKYFYRWLLHAVIPIANNQRLRQKMTRCPMPIRHRRLFFWSDKVTCLIVVFLVLAALTPRRPSSAYLNSADAALDGEWCSFFIYYVLPSVIPTVVLTPCRHSSSRPSDDNHEKAAASERPAKAATGKYGGWVLFQVWLLCFFHLHDSHLAAQRVGHEVEQGAFSRTHFLNLI